MNPLPTVESCLVIDASRWMGAGILRDGDAFVERWDWIDAEGNHRSMLCEVDTTPFARPTVRLTYDRKIRFSYESLEEQIRFTVELTTTRPRFGGLRWWFLCPLLGPHNIPCRARAHRLYLPPGKTLFGCRLCHGLSYQSKLENASERALRKARKIRAGLGGTAFGNNADPPKPKGMWNRTYRRKVEQAKAAEERSLQRRADMFEIDLEELKESISHGHDDNSHCG